MSRLGTKTYSRKPECRTSIQFDALLVDKSNKPSTAKVSVAGIHRWGMTSFTSLRKSRLNGQKDIPDNSESSKRMKLEAQPPMPQEDDPFSFNTDIDISAVDLPSANSAGDSDFSVVAEIKPSAPKPNKFFKSGGSRAFGKGRSAANSTNNDFDALRLSISNCSVIKTNKDHFLTNTNSNFRDEGSHVISDNCSFMTNTPPNIVDLRFPSNASEMCASTGFIDSRPQDSLFTKLAPFSSSSSQDFDNLRTITYSRKPSNLEEISNVNFEPPAYTTKEWKYTVTNNDAAESSLINSYSDNIASNENVINVIDLCENHSVPANNEETEDIFVSKLNDAESFDFKSSQSSSILSSNDYESDLYITPSSSQSQDEKTEVHEVASKKLHSKPKKIFRSLKPKAVYNHRHWHSSKKETDEDAADQAKPSLADEFDDEMSKETFKEGFTDKITDFSNEAAKPVAEVENTIQLYTRVRNVKQAYQCHESGETQEFNDDIEYLLECVQECNGIGTRCLSILNLAAKCMGPAFRIHLRAHGTMPKIFSALKDAPTDPNLALCTSTLMFVLSQDRLTMDIEASTLSLMLQLLETDPEMRCPEKEYDLILKDPALCAMQDKHREKVYQLCEEMQQKGHAKHLKLNNINTGILAMETLLSLTSRKAGEWFKEEMRTLHGLDHLTDTVKSCVDLLIPEEQELAMHPNEVQLDRIRKIDRCLRVVENVTYMNFENQEYLMHYKDSSLIISCSSLMKVCNLHLLEKPTVDNDVSTTDAPSQQSERDDSPFLPCLLSLLKVLINLTHENSLNDSEIASGGLMENVLICILQVPRSVSVEKRFDLLVLSLGLFINLVEYCTENRGKFMEMYAIGSFDSVNDGYEMLASEAFIELMLNRLEMARMSEEQADELLTTQEEKHAAAIEKKDLETAAEDLEETLMKTLQKAGKHMEHSIIAAYIAILLGCVIQNNKDFAEVLKDQVPDGKFDVMIDVLKKFMSFVSLSGSVGNKGVKSIQRVIQVLESS